MEYKRIYIQYSERSGSNLLRLLLGNHSKLSAPVAPQLWDGFKASASRLGNLGERENALGLISVMKEYTNHPFSDWGLDLSADEIYSINTPQSFAEIVDALYLAKAIRDNKEGYVCKENNLFNYRGFIESCIPDTCWIYLYRDPRDVVHSWLKNNMRFFTAYRAAKSWESDQRKCLELNRAHNFPSVEISYEDLITNTEEIISKVLAYAGLEIESKCFENSTYRKEAGKNILWKNLNKPIDRTNLNKYKSGLTRRQIEVIEDICREIMKDLGFEFTGNPDSTFEKGTFYKYLDRFRSKIRKKIYEDKRTKELISDRDKFKNELLKKLL